MNNPLSDKFQLKKLVDLLAISLVYGLGCLWLGLRVGRVCEGREEEKEEVREDSTEREHRLDHHGLAEASRTGGSAHLIFAHRGL